MFERYQFWGRNQSEGEPVDQWLTDLRTKAVKCDFQTHESDMIRDKIVFGVHDTRIKERLLREAGCAYAEKRESSWENISQAYVTSDR